MLGHWTEHQQGHWQFLQCEWLWHRIRAIEQVPSAAALPVTHYVCPCEWCVLWLHCHSENEQPDVTIVAPIQLLPEQSVTFLWL